MYLSASSNYYDCSHIEHRFGRRLINERECFIGFQNHYRCALVVLDPTKHSRSFVKQYLKFYMPTCCQHTNSPAPCCMKFSEIYYACCKKKPYSTKISFFFHCDVTSMILAHYSKRNFLRKKNFSETNYQITYCTET